MNLIKGAAALLSALSIAFSAVSASAQSGVVTADILNVRSYTDTSADVIAQLCEGSELEIIGSDTEWYKISLGDSVGYVKSEYVTLNPAYYGVVTASSLIVRASTGTSYEALSTLPNGSVVELLAYDGEWYKIKYHETKTGYVKSEYISQDLSLASPTPYVSYGYINASNLNIRETTSITSPIVAKLPQGSCVEILAYDGYWYKVSLPDGTLGYASATYVSQTPVEALIPEEAPTEYGYNTPIEASSVPYAEAANENDISFGEKIVNTAYEYLGCPYVWAADGPDKFDCSGFTMYILNLYGISLPHQSGQQYNYGSFVDKSSLIPGDLVFFSSPGKTTVAHVGIYIGDNNFIHASSGSAKSVTISSLSANYYTTYYLGARRMF